MTRLILILFASAMVYATAGPAWGAAHVQTAANSGGATDTISVTLTLTAGNAAYVALLTFGSSTWTQTAGDALTLIDDNSGQIRLYYDCAVAGGSTTFTFQMDNPSAFPTMFVSEFSGSQASCDDQHTTNSDGTPTTTTSSGTTGTTTQASEVVYALFSNDIDTTFVSISNGFTVPANGDRLTSVSSGVRGLVAYKIVGAIGTHETTLTAADARTWRNIIGTFKATGSGAPRRGRIF